MNIISRKALLEFAKEHPNAREPLNNWFRNTRRSQWRSLIDVREVYPSADLVGRFTVFNIGGNNYRLIVRIEFTLQRIYIRHILTHAEYDRGWWKNDDWYS